MGTGKCQHYTISVGGCSVAVNHGEGKQTEHADKTLPPAFSVSPARRDVESNIQPGKIPAFVFV